MVEDGGGATGVGFWTGGSLVDAWADGSLVEDWEGCTTADIVPGGPAFDVW